jgi:hypothetical protein
VVAGITIAERGALGPVFCKTLAAKFEDSMTPINEEHYRIAYCECGAQLVGDSQQELFDATQCHLAHHHPQLLGAFGLDVVQQMAEEHPGAMTA